VRVRRWRRSSEPRRLRRFSPWRWAAIAAGLGVLVGALAGAADPYRQIRQFREVMECERGVGGCFATERSSIVDRRSYVEMQTDPEGNAYPVPHFEVTWRRADGSRESREVSDGLYRKARPGQPVTLRLWRGDVVALEAAGTTEWFLPSPGLHLTGWLLAAHFGLGVLLWGLLMGWWDAFVFFVLRAFSWMLTGLALVGTAVEVLSYGPRSEGGRGWMFVFYGVLFTAGAVFTCGLLKPLEDD